MPQVPYSPTPQVGMDVAPVRDVAVQGVSAAAFGGDVAEGLTGLGKTLDNVGDEWFKRAMALQKLNNESEAREAEAGYTIAAGELSAKYNALQGKDAIVGRAPYVESLRKLREEHMNGLSNDESRRAFSSSSLGTLSRLTLYSATHAATENRKYVKGAAIASAAAAADAVAQTPDDDMVVAAAKDKASHAASMVASIDGVGVEQAAQGQREALSGVSTIQINAVADKDPFRAQALLEQNRANMTAGDIAKVETKIESRQKSVGADRAESEINADLRLPSNSARPPEKGLAEREADARKWAQARKPDDPEFERAVVLRVQSGYTRHKAVQRDDELRNAYDVNSAILGSSGSLPTNPDELRALSPEIAKAWDALPPQRRRTLEVALANNAAGDVPESAATIREYNRVRGEATSEDPEIRNKFINSDVAGLGLPFKNRNALARLQEQVRKGDLLTGVQTTMRNLQAAGIAPTSARNSVEDVNVFRGALQDALDNFQKEKKRPPDLKEQKEIGSRLVQEVVNPDSFWQKTFGIGGKSPVFLLPIPEAVDKAMIQEDEARGITTTPEQRRQRYVSARYRELLTSGAAKAMK